MHLVSLDAFSNDDLTRLLDAAARFDEAGCRGFRNRQEDKILCTAFFEPSTRTRLSFEAAAHRLGAQVIGFADAATTSGTKGETLEDAVRVLSGYGDALVMRHPRDGAAADAARVATVPVINAGDGAGLHPTQTLVDLYTIRRAHGDLAGLRVAVVGDLRYGRTVHSLVPALRRFGASVQAVPAPGLGLPDPLAGEAQEVTLDEAADADVIYMTRVQKERLPPDVRTDAAPRIDAAWLKRTNSRSMVLHPLPRVDEIAKDVDDTAAAKYFEQSRHGVPVRMAVLDLILGEAA